MKFQEQGLTPDAVDRLLDEMKHGDADWRGGRVPLYVFKGSDAAYEAGRNAFFKYFSENALGATRAFPSMRRMESEVVGMGLELFGAPEGAAGNMTSGGSESIFMAVRAAREHARATRGRPGMTGNLVMPESAHPAFSKAAAVMDLQERRIPVGADFRADAAAMAAAVDEDTLMLVGSAPCFPYGVIDPIDALSELAQARGLWLHVDACVGGYLAPFVRELGRPVPAFDLSLAGVSSLSADLHKFGFCPKPASTVFYRTAELAARQVFDLDVWPNGRFVTSTLVGTRPGGAVAGAWATMKVLGRSGYREIARQMMQARDAYLDGVREAGGWQPLGQPHLTIMAWGHPDADVFRVADGMTRRGWVPGLVRKPAALHMMMSMLHAPAREAYLHDLREATREAIENPLAPVQSQARYG